VLTIKSAFVGTPMTTAFAIWASPTVAHSIARAIIGGRNVLIHTVVLVADHDGHPHDSGAHFGQAQTVIPPRRWGDL
jgi:hypothetical protein